MNKIRCTRTVHAEFLSQVTRCILLCVATIAPCFANPNSPSLPGVSNPSVNPWQPLFEHSPVIHNMTMENTPVIEVIEYLTRRADINVLFDPSIQYQQTVTAVFSEIMPCDAFAKVLSIASLEVGEVEGRTLFINHRVSRSAPAISESNPGKRKSNSFATSTAKQTMHSKQVAAAGGKKQSAGGTTSKKIDPLKDYLKETHLWFDVITAEEVLEPVMDTYYFQERILAAQLKYGRLLKGNIASWYNTRSQIPNASEGDEIKLKAIAVDYKWLITDLAHKCMEAAKQCEALHEYDSAQFLAQNAYHGYYALDKSDPILGDAYRVWYRSWSAIDAATKAKAAQYK